MRTYNPDDELIAFAEWFSLKYREIFPGRYYSNNQKYFVDYLHLENTKTTARIEAANFKVEINYSLLADDKLFTPEYVFYIVLWSFAFVENLRRRHDDPCSSATLLKTDQMTMQYYLTTGKSKKLLLIGVKHQFDISPSPINIERYLILKKR